MEQWSDVATKNGYPAPARRQTMRRFLNAFAAFILSTGLATMTNPLPPETIAELRRLAAAATPAPWEHDNTQDKSLRLAFETMYGPGGEKAQSIFGSENSSAAVIYEEYNEGTYFWDETAKNNFALIAAMRNNIDALLLAAEQRDTLARDNASLVETARKNTDIIEHLLAERDRLRELLRDGVWRVPDWATGVNADWLRNARAALFGNLQSNRRA